MVFQVQPQQSTSFYPDSDNQPIANNTMQYRWIVVIQQNLEWWYAADPNVFVAGDLFWYPVEGRNDIVTAPDVMVALGRPKGDPCGICEAARGSYKQWEENNTAPQVVFEILSPSNTFDASSEGLQLFYPNGEPFLTYSEVAQRLSQATQQLEQTEQQLEQTESQLQVERRRAEALAERLRNLGIDPNQIG